MELLVTIILTIDTDSQSFGCLIRGESVKGKKQSSKANKDYSIIDST